MDVFHPKNADQFAERNALLQACMRPEPLPFSIDTEYPIVLSESDNQFSYCHAVENKIVSHANLWPRIWSDATTGKKFKVGLIGNVATDESMRGRGLMSSLFEELNKIAEQSGLEALILWSDLLPFYQKLGYNAHSREIRCFFNCETLRQLKNTRNFLPIEADRLSPSDCQLILNNRFSLPATLDRAAEEFKSLLHIPVTDLFLEQSQGKSFGILGKGYDMGGVIHEWGANSKEDLLDMAIVIANTYDFEDLVILCPGNIPEDWLTFLGEKAANVENHPMALVKSMGGSNSSQILESIASGFIWGLDSI